ncbi:MAG: FecR domain-containing protein [Rhodospirillaceae bacterium]|nr:FecR domain-containing protein [Rhodospirillaceae bacterium]
MATLEFWRRLTALLTLTALPAMAQDKVGEVAGVSGAATIDRAGATQPATVGAVVAADDLLTTGPNGKLRVVFADQSEITLGPDAEVLVDEFVYGRGAADNAVLKLVSGPARFISGALARAENERFSVNTPVAVIGIRGTDFFTEQRGERLSVALFSGYAVAVTNDSGTTVLRPGEGTDAYGPAQPTPALSWQPDRINRALDLVSILPDDRRPLPFLKPVANAPTIADALADGQLFGHFRLRYEHVDEAAKPRAAHATTLRGRLGYETAALNGFFAGVEGEATVNLGDRRNDGVNGRAGLPLIADPDSEVLNQAYVGWTGADDDGQAMHRIVAGRQTLNYENERWLGSVGFRQNDQTFDAVTAETRAIDGVAIRYAYLDRVNRIFGNNPNGRWQSDSHAIAVTTNLVPRSLVTAFAYVLDLKPVPQFSSRTLGLRWDGKWPVDPDTDVSLEAEFASQADHAANPRNYDLSYWLVRPGVRLGRASLFAGWERLGGNGTAAVQTPLATLHRHNGWADVFLVTPANGLSDLHVRAVWDFADVGPLKTPRIDLRAHQFKPVNGDGRRYGRELDADVSANVLGWGTLGVRFARYDAAAFDSDTTKVWLYAEIPL